jgi:hypothetical protein
MSKTLAETGANGLFVTLGTLGMSGSGKTTFCEALVRPFPRVVILDWQDDDKFDSYERVTLKTLPEAMRRDEYAIVYRGESERPRIIEYVEAIEHVYDNGRNLVIYFDEIAEYAPHRRVPECVRGCFARGRRKGFTIIWNTHRLREVDPCIRAQTHAIALFKTTEEIDLEACKVPKIAWPDVAKFNVGEFRIYKDKAAFDTLYRASRAHAERILV